ncbi:MAG TPA: hypothetical protein DCE67_01445 [Barnesiella intestinihominis]|jgi:hypothetical protein|nr:hypothetical protein [Barnesiella intestinihominis]
MNITPKSFVSLQIILRKILSHKYTNFISNKSLTLDSFLFLIRNSGQIILLLEHHLKKIARQTIFVAQ